MGACRHAQDDAQVQETLAFDIHVRRDVDERFPAEGVRVVAKDIQEGIVYASNGVRVTGFLVDHGPVKPAFGYRVDFDGHSVAIPPPMSWRRTRARPVGR